MKNKFSIVRNITTFAPDRKITTLAQGEKTIKKF